MRSIFLSFISLIIYSIDVNEGAEAAAIAAATEGGRQIGKQAQIYHENRNQHYYLPGERERIWTAHEEQAKRGGINGMVQAAIGERLAVVKVAVENKSRYRLKVIDAEFQIGEGGMQPPQSIDPGQEDVFIARYDGRSQGSRAIIGYELINPINGKQKALLGIGWISTFGRQSRDPSETQGAVWLEQSELDPLSILHRPVSRMETWTLPNEAEPQRKVEASVVSGGGGQPRIIFTIQSY